ncbi:MAG: amino acid adenylation domain-containing protein [Chloroflexota bacterium]
MNLDERKLKLSAARKALLEKRLKGLKSKRESERATPIKPILAGLSSGSQPMSYAQQRFWFMDQITPDSAAYNMYEAQHVKGPLNLKALQTAIDRVVRRQQVLTSNFTVKDGEPRAMIHPERQIQLDIYDMQGASFEAAVQRGNQLAGCPFNLAEDPLLRFSVLKLGEEEHLLVLVIHHIVSDEYANACFWDELAYFYNQQDGDGEPHELPIQYGDFSRWQSEMLADGVADKELSYWKKELSGTAPRLQLPVDSQVGGAPSENGRFVERSLRPELASRLERVAKESGASPFMVHLALFHLLLFRYTGQEDIWVGTPVANRQREEVSKLIGLFLNTVIVRAQLNSDMGFLDVLKLVQEKSLAAVSHQNVPYDMVVNGLQHERDGVDQDLFRVMFVYSPAAEMARSLPGLETQRVKLESGYAKLDLTFFVTSGPDRFTTAVEYRSDFFESDTINRLLDHFECLLEGVLVDPKRAVGTLPLLTPSEKAQILVEWNQTAYQTHSDGDAQLLHPLILRHGASNGEATAVVCDDVRLSYAELTAKAAALTRYLSHQGINPGDKIGLVTLNRVETIVAVVAILQAGGVYVPLDPDYPSERISYIIEDADLKVLLLDKTVLSLDTFDHLRKTKVDLPLIEIAEGIESGKSLPNKFEPAELTPEPLAYMIYTSGSTGKPKGVMVTHRNIVHSTTARFAFYPHQAERFLLLSSFAFDSSMVGLFWTLCHGGTLVIQPAEERQQLSAIIKTIEIEGEAITHLLALPSLYQLLLEESEPGQLRTLNTVIVAGEACHPALVELHMGLYPEANLYNEYGPTEGSVWSHAYQFPPDFSGPAVPIGKAIPNVTSYVLDGKQQPVPVGIPGELFIGGAGITPGYHNRPELTADRFVFLPERLGVDPRARFYRTGDLVKWMPDGNLVFLGRVDQQVKIRGFRIELEEIESCLVGHSGVQHGVVTVYEQGGANGMPRKHLIAYYEPDAVDQDLALRLKAHIAERLPKYMWPDLFVSLDKLPRTPNGKVDRNALPKPDLSQMGTSGQKGYLPPATPTEIGLAKLWQQGLQIETIGVDDSFFDIGGTSLMAMRIFSQIEDEFGVVLPLAELIEANSIRRLAEVVDRANAVRVPVSDRLIPLKLVENKQAPIFCLHDDLGGIDYYQSEPFLNIISSPKSLYGVVPENWGNKKIEIPTLGELAAQHLASIKTLQPRGPYTLAGIGLGGMLAYAIAAALEAGGEAVENAIVIHPSTPRLSSNQSRISRAILNSYIAALKVDSRIPRKWRDAYFEQIVSRQLRATFQSGGYTGKLMLIGTLEEQRKWAGIHAGQFVMMEKR